MLGAVPIRMEAPLVAKGTRLVSDEAKVLVKIANEKWAANAARAERLRERIAPRSRRSARNAARATITKISERDGDERRGGAGTRS